ncbi:MAG: AAA family ATPase [Gallionella sp.]|nr:AAA family ATPase [Gallionella sp.]MDD4958769.1 AAA family ATPase [Gallionella sp.]
MYLSELKIEHFRQFGKGDKALTLPLNAGLNVLVGENNAGKTTIIDAIRWALGTTDHNILTLKDEDFHTDTKNVNMKCEISLSKKEHQRLLLAKEPKELKELPRHLQWFKKHANDNKPVELYFDHYEKTNGKLTFLHATFLRPLRDIKSAFSASRQSRLAKVFRDQQQVLQKPITQYHTLCLELQTQLLDVINGQSTTFTETSPPVVSNQNSQDNFTRRVLAWLSTPDEEQLPISSQITRLKEWKEALWKDIATTLLRELGKEIGMKMSIPTTVAREQVCVTSALFLAYDQCPYFNHILEHRQKLLVLDLPEFLKKSLLNQLTCQNKNSSFSSRDALISGRWLLEQLWKYPERFTIKLELIMALAMEMHQVPLVLKNPQTLVDAIELATKKIEQSDWSESEQMELDMSGVIFLDSQLSLVGDILNLESNISDELYDKSKPLEMVVNAANKEVQEFLIGGQNTLKTLRDELIEMLNAKEYPNTASKIEPILKPVLELLSSLGDTPPNESIKQQQCLSNAVNQLGIAPPLAVAIRVWDETRREKAISWIGDEFEKWFEGWLYKQFQDSFEVQLSQYHESFNQEYVETIQKDKDNPLGKIQSNLSAFSLTPCPEVQLSSNQDAMRANIAEHTLSHALESKHFNDWDAFFNAQEGSEKGKNVADWEKEDEPRKRFLHALQLTSKQSVGLGYDNLVYIATELLLLEQATEGLKLLLIKEPEAHLHPQLQLKLMKYLDKLAQDEGIQIIVTTHSPNLASAVKLENMTMIQNGQAFSLAEKLTRLQGNDYRFLERFLDVSKANLFFARGVLIVEGIAEEILLPTLAKLIGRDLTDYGVSIVNVGGTGLGRYARIFQRAEGDNRQINIPVACVTDMDVMPNCAPDILKLKKEAKNRQWRAKYHFNNDTEALKLEREEIEVNLAGTKGKRQSVQVFVADEWTFEYDLAYFGLTKNSQYLAKSVHIAARLAKKDASLAKSTKTQDNETFEQALTQEKNTAETDFDDLVKDSKSGDGYNCQEMLATNVYSLFTNGTKASKSIAAQYLADALEKETQFNKQQWREILPPYLVNAIDYVTAPITNPT